MQWNGRISMLWEAVNAVRVVQAQNYTDVTIRLLTRIITNQQGQLVNEERGKVFTNISSSFLEEAFGPVRMIDPPDFLAGLPHLSGQEAECWEKFITAAEEGMFCQIVQGIDRQDCMVFPTNYIITHHNCLSTCWLASSAGIRIGS